MKLRLLVFLSLFSSLVFAQKTDKATVQIQQSTGANPYTSLDLNNDPDKFHFAIVTDRTGSHRPGVFMDGVNKLNLLQPEFVMSVGDLIEGYTTDLDELNRQWDEFDGFVQQLEMPFFYLPGNHDITNQVMEDLWQKRLGATYYHFLYKNVLFLALNSEDQKRGAGKGTISDEQFDYIKRTLEDNKDVRWTLVFMHQPLWNQDDTKRWNEVEELLKNRKHTVYTGHEHSYVKYFRNNANYYVLATTGGGSSLRGPELGEFDHVAWITMTKEGPIMANITLEGILDDAVFTEKMRKHVEHLADNNPFQITPYFMEDDAFDEGNVEIKITNDENFPMAVTFEESNSMELIAMMDKTEITIPPNSVRKAQVHLKKRRFGYDDPVQIDATVTYQPDDLESAISYPFRFNLKPLKKYFLHRVNSPKTIDCRFKDWYDLPFQFSSFDEEMSVKFNLSYDSHYVYFAAQITDSDIVSFGNGAPWAQDNIGLAINAMPLAKSAMSTGREYYTVDEFSQMITPQTSEAVSVLYPSTPMEGATWICKATATGYAAEARIPISYIEERQGQKWKTLRIAIFADDKDGDQITRYWWQPNWMDNQRNVIGSGTFFRK